MSIKVIQKIRCIQSIYMSSSLLEELRKDTHADFSIMSWELQLKCLFLWIKIVLHFKEFCLVWQYKNSNT